MRRAENRREFQNSEDSDSPAAVAGARPAGDQPAGRWSRKFCHESRPARVSVPVYSCVTDKDRESRDVCQRRTLYVERKKREKRWEDKEEATKPWTRILTTVVIAIPSISKNIMVLLLSSKYQNLLSNIFLRK
jgi:hypothetical protein